MDKTAFSDYVEARYKGQMEYYSKSAAKNQNKYKKFQWILIILSAITPVLAALSGKSFRLSEKFILHLDLQIVVIIVSATVAILTTGLKTFNYQELWTNYRSTYEKLKPEIHYYNFSVGPYGAAGIDKESLFVTRVETILDAEHTQWPPAKKLQENRNKPDEETPVTPDPDTVEAPVNPVGGVAEPEIANASGEANQ